MSTRETILAAVATALAGVAGGRVYRTRREQLPGMPAVVIEPASEDGIENVLGKMDHVLTVSVFVYAHGGTPDAAADATLTGAWAALAAAPDLGLGIDVQMRMSYSIPEWSVEDIDTVRADLRVTYDYRTTIGSM